MKRTIIVITLLLISALMFDWFGAQSALTATAKKPLSVTTPTPAHKANIATNPGVSTQEGTADDRALAALIRRLTKRTSDGVVETPHPAGGVQLEIKEGFQFVPVGKVNADGSVSAMCVEDVEGANNFFGRNLETGEVYPTQPREPDASAHHRITPQEQAFLDRLIAEAAHQRLLNPNSATITIINNDGAGEGFNDPAARTPEGGNTGTTLGQQRLNLFNQAASIWGAFLDSSVTTSVRASFDPLIPCSPSGGVLGSAGAAGFQRDFGGAQISGTWYHMALANKLDGTDLNGTTQEINAQFNSDIDNGCLGSGSRWYYGFDNNPPANTNNLLNTLLHEMGHGLGFATAVNKTTGELLNGFPDIYLRFMYDRSVGLYWTQMTNAQRAASAINTSNVLWDGLNVSIASGFLTAGRETSTGRVQLYTPNPVVAGSSLSHWDTVCAPNLLMEPIINQIPLDLDLTRQQMRDIGWYRDTTRDRVIDTITNVLPNSGSVTIGTTINITWTNTGGFNRNVTIELSTNGGTTYPITIASNVANSGSRSWTVPNNPTTTARIRVREYDFNEPRGVSSANFTITGACPTITVSPTNPTLPGGFVGVAYSQTFTQTGGTGTITWSNPGGGLPGGLTLDSPTGLLHGSPTTANTYSFIIRATDANNCIGERLYSLTVTQTCPTITVSPTNPTLTPGTMGTFYSQTFTQTGGTGTITWSNPGGGLPGGLSLNSSGVLSGTPTATGTFSFTIRATDQNNCTGQRQYTLVINAMPCPTITVSPTNPTLTGGSVGTFYSQTFTQTGGAGTITWSNPSGSLPGGLSLNSATGVLSGTPTTANTFTFTIRATDANNCSGERQYTLVISGVNPCNPTPIVVGQTINGQLTTSDCLMTGKYIDYYSFTGVVGQQIAIELNSAAFDTYLILYNPSGGIVQEDDDGGTGTNSRIPPDAGYLSLTATGTYKIAATSYGAGATGSYSISLSEAPMGSTNLKYYPLPYPIRLLDTRAGQVGCDTPGVPITGGTSRTQLARRTCSGVTIPSNAQVVTGNVTTVNSGGGYLTLYPSNASQPLVANTNYLANEIVNNAFTVGLGTDGAFKIFAYFTTHVVIDVTGYYAPQTSTGMYFHPLPRPMRLLETRPGEAGCYYYFDQPIPGGLEISQPTHVTCSGVTIPSSARAVVGNATVVAPANTGYLTLFPADATRPLVASSNYGPNQVVNGPFTVGLSSTGNFKVYSWATTHLVIDLIGYYSTEQTDLNGTGLLYNGLGSPVRMLETRAGYSGCIAPGLPIYGGNEYTLTARGTCQGQTIASTALGLVGNATVVNTYGGYLTFWPSNASRPLIATSNFNLGQVWNRHFMVGLGPDGAFKIYSPLTTDLVIDVSGYFAP